MANKKRLSLFRKPQTESADAELRQWTPSNWPGTMNIGRGFGTATAPYAGYQQAGQVEKSMQVVAVFACIRTISDAVSSLPLVVSATNADGVPTKLSPNDPIAVFPGTRLHPRIPTGELCGIVATHLAGWGNAFLYKGRRPDGSVASLFPVLPSLVEVSIDVDGLPEFTISTSNGGQIKTKTDILHIRSFGVDGVVGLSPIGMARQAVESQELEESYRRNLLNNDARVGGVLSSDNELSPEAVIRVRESWNAAHGGASNAGGTAVLEGGLKWQQMSLSTKDMQFIEQREFGISEIARLFRVPPSIVNAATAGSLTYSTVESQGLALVRDCLMPYLRRIEEALEGDPEVVPTGYDVAFNVDGLLRSDSLTRAQRSNTLVTAGIITRNEARAVEGLPPLEGLDTVDTGGPNA